MRPSAAIGLLACCAGLFAADVEILRDRWGVPHIYARSTEDLFYAQGYMAAKDRLFQMDLWRRQGTGKLAEVLGPSALARDRIARLVRYRGDWDAEWKSYSPDAKKIVAEFVLGINAYIKSLHGQRPVEFQVAGYDPQPWTPEDVVSRVAGLQITYNIRQEVARALDIQAFGLDRVLEVLPTSPPVRYTIPVGLDLSLITREVLRDFSAVLATPGFSDQGSNNWVVDGAMSSTGKPLLANDPHRAITTPSLRKTWHLVAPGWNVIGAGEPALPGIALGHNESVAWGFTVVNMDQQDLYVEKLNPANADEYMYQGSWRKVEVEREAFKVKGRAEPETLELRYTMHGPILYEDRAKNIAYALKWVGAEPGGAAYLGALGLMRAKTWPEFLKAVDAYKTPSENLVYADLAGNIGWIAAGKAPVRKSGQGLLPVPGDSGEFEWIGYVPIAEMPQTFNPASHFIATANHNILPEGYSHLLSLEFSAPFRFRRIEQALKSREKWDRIEFEKLQQDIVSLPARRFQEVLRGWTPAEGTREAVVVSRLLNWDARMRVDSEEALIYELWLSRLGPAMFGPALGSRVSLETVLDRLDVAALQKTLPAVLEQVNKAPKWGEAHTILFQHPLRVKEWNRGPFARPGDGTTVNSTSGPGLRQTSGASYRQVIDLSDWDRSVMTNVPGESGDPRSKHYADLIDAWNMGVYHPMPYSRRYVEASVEERMVLKRE